MPKKILLSAVTAPVVGEATPERNSGSNDTTFQATVTGTGAVTASVFIEFSNDGVGWLAGPTIVLSGTTMNSDGFTSHAAWLLVRASVTDMSPGASVTVTMGY
jgi:hypothetical protein